MMLSPLSTTPRRICMRLWILLRNFLSQLCFLFLIDFQPKEPQSVSSCGAARQLFSKDRLVLRERMWIYSLRTWSRLRSRRSWNREWKGPFSLYFWDCGCWGVCCLSCHGGDEEAIGHLGDVGRLVDRGELGAEKCSSLPINKSQWVKFAVEDNYVVSILINTYEPGSLVVVDAHGGLLQISPDSVF